MTLTKVVALTNRKPRIEHLAVVNPIVTTEGYRGEIAITKCGKLIRLFWKTDDTSDYSTDGTIYKTPCPLCAKA